MLNVDVLHELDTMRGLHTKNTDTFTMPRRSYMQTAKSVELFVPKPGEKHVLRVSATDPSSVACVKAGSEQHNKLWRDLQRFFRPGIDVPRTTKADLKAGRPLIARITNRRSDGGTERVRAVVTDNETSDGVEWELFLIDKGYSIGSKPSRLHFMPTKYGTEPAVAFQAYFDCKTLPEGFVNHGEYEVEVDGYNERSNKYKIVGLRNMASGEILVSVKPKEEVESKVERVEEVRKAKRNKKRKQNKKAVDTSLHTIHESEEESAQNDEVAQLSAAVAELAVNNDGTEPDVSVSANGPLIDLDAKQEQTFTRYIVPPIIITQADLDTSSEDEQSTGACSDLIDLNTSTSEAVELKAKNEILELLVVDNWFEEQITAKQRDARHLLD